MSYATKSEADTYHAARLTAAAWAALADATKLLALQSASDAMDDYAAEHGGWIEEYTALTYPQALKDACCIEALELSRGETDARKRAQEQGVTSVCIGSASETYGTNKLAGVCVSSVRARSLLMPYVVASSSGVSMR